MAKCFISDNETVTFQYVSFTESGDDPRRVFCRFDRLSRAHLELPRDFAEPITVRWNPGRESDRLGLEEHRRLASDPRMRALPGLCRDTVGRDELRQKMSQFIAAREKILNP